MIDLYFTNGLVLTRVVTYPHMFSHIVYLYYVLHIFTHVLKSRINQRLIPLTEADSSAPTGSQNFVQSRWLARGGGNRCQFGSFSSRRGKRFLKASTICPLSFFFQPANHYMYFHAPEAKKRAKLTYF